MANLLLNISFTGISKPLLTHSQLLFCPSQKEEIDHATKKEQQDSRQDLKKPNIIVPLYDMKDPLVLLVLAHNCHYSEQLDSSHLGSKTR